MERRHDEVDPGSLLDVVVEHLSHVALVIGRRQILEEGGAADRAPQQGDGRMPGQDVIGGEHRALGPLHAAERTAGLDFMLEPMETHRGRWGSIPAPPHGGGAAEPHSGQGDR